MYGELPPPATTSTPDPGSSPRVRGTLRIAGRVQQVRRFIPACTGNSVNSRALCRIRTVHPRVYGELASRWHYHGHAVGSSPRVRGTRQSWARPVDRRWFISACTGNSLALVSTARIVPVHPRVYGELFLSAVESFDTPGSSPRVRGTRAEHRARRAVRRFIPACTGNSSNSRSSTGCVPVHPRVYGELRQGAAKKYRFLG